MTVVGYNAAMHAASVLGRPDRALELLEEMKVRGSVSSDYQRLQLRVVPAVHVTYFDSLSRKQRARGFYAE